MDPDGKHGGPEWKEDISTWERTGHLYFGATRSPASSSYPSDSPFGGYKNSGIGKKHGIEGFEEYLNTKTIGVPA
jgi:acyl-CoA reductase-like NAD-dependent aldehyde dehydrogenase